MSRDHVHGGVVGNITVASVPLIHVCSKKVFEVSETSIPQVMENVVDIAWCSLMCSM